MKKTSSGGQQKLKIDTKTKSTKKYSAYTPKTINGYPLDEVRSALQKSIRRGKEWEAYYWSYELYESGMWAYLTRTLVTIAGEDIGLANPQLMPLCMNSYLYWMNIKQYRDKQKQRYAPHWNELGLLIVLLVRSQKNRYVDLITGLIDKKRKDGWRLKVDEISLDQHTRRGKKLLKEQGKDFDREFYHRGAKTKNHIWVEREKEVKEELMKELGYPDLALEDEEAR